MNLDLQEKTTPPTAVPTGTKDRRSLPILKRKGLIALVVICVAAGGALWHLFGGNNTPAAATVSAYTTAAVQRRDITASITGSGSLQAANSYSVTTLLEGAILAADFEEGDQVQEGTVLYTIDSSGVSSSLEQAEISLNQARRNYNSKLKNQENLTVKAAVAGRILALNVEVGDEVSAGQAVATIRNYDVMSLSVPFPADDAGAFFPGQTASVTLDSTFETLNGTVSRVDANDTVLAGNVIVRYVTIQVSNPGGLTSGQVASAQVGGAASSGSGTFTYEDEAVVTAKTAGKVAALNFSEGDWVDKNQALALLTSDTLTDELQSAAESVRNAELSLESRYDQLDNYTITSPIRGTIIDKNYKAGETTESNQVLCTIYDLSYLTMTLSVDELDISEIAVGQTVAIVADAVDNRAYEGVVTKVSVAGSTSSGVTTYPVTIRIDETEGLRPGMNVDATILLGSASDVLTIPAAALQRGNTVLVTADSPSAVGAGAAAGLPADGRETQLPEGAQRSGDPQGTQGYVAVPVTVGISDDDYLEITSGLQEGDVVAYIPTSSSGNAFGMPNMVIGVPGGGMAVSRSSSGPMTTVRGG